MNKSFSKIHGKCILWRFTKFCNQVSLFFHFIFPRVFWSSLPCTSGLRCCHRGCIAYVWAARLFLHSLQQWVLKVPYLGVLLPVFIFHLLEKQSERQRSWTHWFMIYFPHGHSNQNSARPKSGARNSLLAPRFVARTQVLGPSCIAFQSLHL